MYKIYVDDLIIYHPLLDDYPVTSAKLDTEVNKAGKLTLTVPTFNKNYTVAALMKSIFKVYENDKLIFRGRYYSPRRDLYLDKNITVEGELAFLNDSIIEPYAFYGTVKDFLTQLINSHNSQVESSKHFKVGIVNVINNTEAGYITRASIEYEPTWKVLKEKLIDKLEGYIRLRHELDGVYIDYLQQLNFQTAASQTVEQCINLIDAKEEINPEPLATRVIPLGARIKDALGNDTDERLTIASINSGKKYIESEEGIKKYGTITKVVVHDDITLPENLKKAGEKDLASALGVYTSLELKAADLSKAGYDVDAFAVGTMVNVKIQSLGVNRNMVVKKLSIDILHPESSELSIGDRTKSFTASFDNSVSKTNYLATQVEASIRKQNQSLVKVNSAINNTNEKVEQLNMMPRVLEEADSGIWHYKKHSSGLAELWCNMEINIQNWTSEGSMFVSDASTAADYPFALVATPKIWPEYQGDDIKAVAVITSKADSLSLPSIALMSAKHTGPTTVNVAVYVIGQYQ